MAESVNTVHSAWTSNIIALAADAGADADALWKAGGLVADQLAEEIPESAHLRVWEAIMRALRSPGFPVRVANQRSINEYALLGLACKTSRTVRDAIEHLIRFMPIWNSEYRCELRARDESADLILHGPTGDLGRRCTNESAVAQIVKAMRDVCGVPVRPLRACFRHASPGDISDHESFFDCPVEFESPFDGIELSKATLDTHLVLADDSLATFLVAQLEELAAMRASSEPLTDKVRRVISQLLPSGSPKLEAVADKLAVSPRTLQRQLSSVNTTFAELTDQTRQDLAATLLRNTDRSVAEISFVLGFSEPSAFHRAFKRWTGSTPAAFRAS
jgi:AraC-like DNA-binding protein